MNKKATTAQLKLLKLAIRHTESLLRTYGALDRLTMKHVTTQDIPWLSLLRPSDDKNAAKYQLKCLRGQVIELTKTAYVIVEIDETKRGCGQSRRKICSLSPEYPRFIAAGKAMYEVRVTNDPRNPLRVTARSNSEPRDPFQFEVKTDGSNTMHDDVYGFRFTGLTVDAFKEQLKELQDETYGALQQTAIF